MAATIRIIMPTEKTVFTTDFKTAIAVIVTIAAGWGAWISVKADIADHSRQLTVIQSTLGADHDALKVQGTLLGTQGELLERMDKKLDHLASK